MAEKPLTLVHRDPTTKQNTYIGTVFMDGEGRLNLSVNIYNKETREADHLEALVFESGRKLEVGPKRGYLNVWTNDGYEVVKGSSEEGDFF